MAVTGRSKEICCANTCPGRRYNQIRRLISMRVPDFQQPVQASSLGLAARTGRRYVAGHPAEHRLDWLAFLELDRTTDQYIAVRRQIGELAAHFFNRHADCCGYLGIEALTVASQVLQYSVQLDIPLKN
jgi:hypothetical protein